MPTPDRAPRPGSRLPHALPCRSLPYSWTRRAPAPCPARCAVPPACCCPCAPRWVPRLGPQCRVRDTQRSCSVLPPAPAPPSGFLLVRVHLAIPLSRCRRSLRYVNRSRCAPRPIPTSAMHSCAWDDRRGVARICTTCSRPNTCRSGQREGHPSGRSVPPCDRQGSRELAYRARDGHPVVNDTRSGRGSCR